MADSDLDDLDDLINDVGAMLSDAKPSKGNAKAKAMDKKPKSVLPVRRRLCAAPPLTSHPFCRHRSGSAKGKGGATRARTGLVAPGAPPP